MTINSMTAFARESVATPQGTLTIELRSVNHRYLDFSFKLPDNLRSAEAKFREIGSKALARGKIDCFMRLQASSQQSAALTINRDYLQQLLQASSTIEQQLEQSRPLSALEVLQFPGICQQAADSEDGMLQTSNDLFSRAIANLQANRQREGKKLAGLIQERLQQVQVEVDSTRARMPELMAAQRQRVINRIEALAIESDQDRLEQELVYLAQKSDVDEELDRLDAHVQEVTRTLAKGGPCGRRLDFLMQELNREANTLSSKSTASSTTQNAVELKVLIEQMREQIQNIE